MGVKVFETHCVINWLTPLSLISQSVFSKIGFKFNAGQRLPAESSQAGDVPEAAYRAFTLSNDNRVISRSVSDEKS